MSIENIVKESNLCDIKIELMDSENVSGINNDELHTPHLIKAENNIECFSDLKVEEHSTDEEGFHLKIDKDSFNIRDNEEHHEHNYVKEEETLNIHFSAHKREKVYSCNTCSKNFDLHSQLESHLKTHTEIKNHLCSQCGIRRP